jgi:hypothetical protein
MRTHEKCIMVVKSMVIARFIIDIDEPKCNL